jgi:uncharacterized protein
MRANHVFLLQEKVCCDHGGYRLYTARMDTARILILPGWQGSGPDHWQSRWEHLQAAQRVEQHDWMRPLRGDWITRLESVVQEGAKESYLLLNQEQTMQTGCAQTTQKARKTQPDTVLVAHSLGCHLVAAWAAVSPSTDRIGGALLVAPPDCMREGWPAELHSWRQPVMQALPFASLCVSSTDDPFDPDQRGAAMAARWGSAHISLGARGHINAASGLGDWPEGLAMLRQWLPARA